MSKKEIYIYIYIYQDELVKKVDSNNDELLILIDVAESDLILLLAFIIDFLLCKKDSNVKR